MRGSMVYAGVAIFLIGAICAAMPTFEQSAGKLGSVEVL